MKFVSSLLFFGGLLSSVDAKPSMEHDFLSTMNKAGKQGFLRKANAEKRKQLWRKLLSQAKPVNERDLEYNYDGYNYQQWGNQNGGNGNNGNNMYDGQYYQNGGNQDNQYEENGIDWTNLGFDMTQYSLKYTGCSAVQSYDSYKAANGADSVLTTKRFALFRLCPSDNCNKYTVNGCARNYGSYVLEMDTFLEGVVEFNRQRYWHYCHFCKRCNSLESFGDVMANYADAEEEYYEELEEAQQEYYQQQAEKYQYEDQEYANENAAYYQYGDDAAAAADDAVAADEGDGQRKLDQYANYNYGGNSNYDPDAQDDAVQEDGEEQEEENYDEEYDQYQAQYQGKDEYDEDYPYYYNGRYFDSDGIKTQAMAKGWNEDVYGEWSTDWNLNWLSFNWRMLPYCSTDELESCDNAENMCGGYDEDFADDADAMDGFSACTQVGNGYYIAPHCGSDGYTISLGVYTDQYCDEYVGDQVSLADVLGYDIEEEFDFFPEECVSCSVSDEEVEFNNFMSDEYDMDYYETWMDQRWFDYIDSLEEQNSYWSNQQAQAEYQQQQRQYYQSQNYEDGDQDEYYYRNGQLYQQGGGNYYGNYGNNGAMSGMYGQYSSLGNNLVASGTDFYSNRGASWMNPWMNAEVYEQAKENYDEQNDFNYYFYQMQQEAENDGQEYDEDYWQQIYYNMYSNAQNGGNSNAYGNYNRYNNGNDDAAAEGEDEEQEDNQNQYQMSDEDYDYMEWKFYQYQMYRQYQNRNSGGGNYNGNQWFAQGFSDTGIADVCGALYSYAAKCNNHFYNSNSSRIAYGSSQQASNEEQVCNFIENLQSRKYNEFGEIVLDESDIRMDMSKVNVLNPASVAAEASRSGVTGGQMAGLVLLALGCVGLIGYAVVLHSTLTEKNIPWRPRRGKLAEPTDITRQNSGIVMGRSRSGMSGKNAPLI